MIKKPRMQIEVHPKKVLIKITASEWNDLFSIWIRRPDGTKVQLFTDVEEDEGFARRFEQNVSVGTILAAGSKTKGLLKGDVAIIDYLVTGNDVSFVGVQNGNRLVAIVGQTTYHEDSSPPYLDGRRAWVKGDYDTVSPLLGFVRLGKLVACQPYVFLRFEQNQELRVTDEGSMYETKDFITVREVLAAHPDSGYKEGDKVIVKDPDLFTRTIKNKFISVTMERDILGIAK